MCYKVITHTMRCDMRAIISDGETIYADPFAEPISCGCLSEKLRPWLQCDTHGCCLTYAKMQYCPKISSCNDVVQLHRYVQASRQPTNIWRTSHDSVWSLPFAQVTNDWRDIRELDACLFPTGMPCTTSFGPVFNEALHNLVAAGRLIAATQLRMDALLNDVGSRRTKHDRLHGEACERVLNEWECAARGPIETGEALAKQMGKALGKQMEVFDASLELMQTVVLVERVSEELVVDELVVVMDD
ncbi:hypothetical protein F66182_6511 [Fusarium sp. NRRL 66182]|nr:hypothetical protein F66182_6511 [Fusarium sp. NRRL 66182]